jgi:hypothetical protein
MLNMVLHTLLTHVTVHPEGSAQSEYVLMLVFCFGRYGYHFRHIVEMFWAPIYGAPVPKVRAPQNR